MHSLSFYVFFFKISTEGRDMLDKPILLRLCSATRLQVVLLFLMTCAILSSCASVQCPECDRENDAAQNVIRLDEIFIVEFKDPHVKESKIEKRKVNTLKSATQPILVHNPDNTYFFEIVEIDKEKAYELSPTYRSLKNGIITMDEYIEVTREYVSKYSNRIKLQDTLEIKNISRAADVDVPPTVTNISIQDFCACCIRDRECVSRNTIFDKIEARVMGGYRMNANESIFYDGPNGGTYYNKETFGFDRGGTDIVAGIETAWMWDITDWIKPIVNIPARNSFHIGPMIGVWPVDGSIFIPISLHPRYTFSYNDTDPLNDQCNAWYLFGDLGVPIDPSFNVPVFCDGGECSDLFAYFYSIGIGRDWWMSECMDFSLDLGFRVSNTPLPSYSDCEECTNSQGKNPFRKISQLFLRFGFTW